MQSLASELARRRVRVKDYFRDYDKLNSGNVTVEQFRRVLATADVLKVLGAGDVDDLIHRYAHGTTFRYADFVQDLDVLEQTASSTASLQRVGRAPQQGSALHSAFVACVQQVRSNGVDVRQAFHPFDKHNNGKISASQFQRSFPFRVDANAAQAIADQYTTGGVTDYLAFEADLKAHMAAEANAGPYAGSTTKITSPTKHANTTDWSDVSTTLAELRYHLTKEQVNVQDAFKDYDRLRSGVVTAGQFSSALGRIVLRGFKLSQEALAKVIDAYAVEGSHGERVSYSRFLRDLDEATAGGPRTNPIDAAEEERLRNILGRVRTAVRTRRINLKPTFQDYDRANKGIFRSLTCTRTRFERALALNNVVLPTADVDLLEKAYAVNRAGEVDTDAINYLAFCREVDAPEGAVESPQLKTKVLSPVAGVGTYNATTGTTHVKKAPTLQRVLDTTMLQIADRSIRLQEFIRDYDPLRSGVVTKDKLSTAISMSGLKLEPAEVDLLLGAYATEPGSDKIAYPRLLAALDCDAAGEGDHSVHRVDEARARVQAEAQAATEAHHSDQLVLILQRIKDDVKARQILLPPFFQDYDKHHRGTITAAQFERVVCRHRLPVSPADIQVLKQYFADPTDANNVRCRDFIAAVDSAEASRLPKHLRSPPQSKAPTLASSSASHKASRGGMAASPEPQLADVLGKVNRMVLSRNVRVSEFFRDADPLRKGYCHESRFASALTALGVGLTEREIAVLREAYDEPRNAASVNYSQFVREVEDLEFQRAAGAAELTASRGVTLRAKPPQGDIAAVESAVAADPFLGKVIATVRSAVAARRIDVKASLQDFDKLRKGRIPASQFFSALSAHHITFNALETSKLAEVLTDSDSGGINYVIFCRLVEA